MPPLKSPDNTDKVPTLRSTTKDTSESSIVYLRQGLQRGPLHTGHLHNSILYSRRCLQPCLSHKPPSKQSCTPDKVCNPIYTNGLSTHNTNTQHRHASTGPTRSGAMPEFSCDVSMVSEANEALHIRSAIMSIMPDITGCAYLSPKRPWYLRESGGNKPCKS